MFAWQRFLESRNIPYREGGKFEILVHCPFCGENDPSQHLSISLRNRGWRCLRVEAHKGKAYARILAALIGGTEDYARELLGERARVIPPKEEFADVIRKRLGVKQEKVERPQRIKFDEDMKPLLEANGRFPMLFWNYIRNRGYTASEACWVVKTYNLRYAIAGRFAYRLIIPVFSATRALMTWTGRDISGGSDIRYKTLHSDESVESPTNLVLGLDFLWTVYKPRCLVVTEGPFDAMAISTLGERSGIWGTCLFGVQLSDAQALLLDDLSRKFDRIRLLVDPDARMKTLRFQDRLPRSCEVRQLGEGLKDPGELPMLKRREVDSVLNALL